MNEEELDPAYNFSEETQENLELSIKHWEKVAAGERKEIGRSYCALCSQFNPWDKEQGYCVDSVGNSCPVKIYTGLAYCLGFDAYKAAATEYERWPTKGVRSETALRVAATLKHIQQLGKENSNEERS
jgi:hypothetical protein